MDSRTRTHGIAQAAASNADAVAQTPPTEPIAPRGDVATSLEQTVSPGPEQPGVETLERRCVSCEEPLMPHEEGDLHTHCGELLGEQDPAQLGPEYEDFLAENEPNTWPDHDEHADGACGCLDCFSYEDECRQLRMQEAG